MTTRFCSRRIEVEAIQVADALRRAAYEWDRLPAWLVKAYEAGGVVFGQNVVMVSMGRGPVAAGGSSWLVRFADGSIGTAGGADFARLYEPIE
jgi:hypothetical protein